MPRWERSMIARRRWPSPTCAGSAAAALRTKCEPSTNPSPSGPRCAMRSVICWSRSVGTRAPAGATMPVMPHISLGSSSVAVRVSVALHRTRVDADHLLGDQLFIEMRDGLTARGATAAFQHALERGGDRVRLVVDAEPAARDLLWPLGHGAGRGRG